MISGLLGQGCEGTGARILDELTQGAGTFQIRQEWHGGRYLTYSPGLPNQLNLVLATKTGCYGRPIVFVGNLELAMTFIKNIQDTLFHNRNRQQRQQSFIATANSQILLPTSHTCLLHVPIAGKHLGESIEVQVMRILSNRAQLLKEHPSRRVMSDRCLRITTCYQDLKGLGFAINDVTVFGLKHAKVLLASWRERGLTRQTIYKRWSALRSWSLVLNKHGMLGPLKELWPELNLDASRKQNSSRTLTKEQIQIKSDWLREKGDKTAYLVDRLCREVGLTRENALLIDRVQVLAITKGQPFLTCGQGLTTTTYTTIATHWRLFNEVLDHMVERNRPGLGWTGLEIHDSIHKYALQMSYASRCLFLREKGKDKCSERNQA
jgi:hypothetical protein